MSGSAARRMASATSRLLPLASASVVPSAERISIELVVALIALGPFETIISQHLRCILTIARKR